MKLKNWADRCGVTYLTAYKWFKAGILPVKAYQTESGTIIVDDRSCDVEYELLDQFMSDIKNKNENGDVDVTLLILNKVVEFSKSDGTVVDFAAYILSNFSLKLKSVTETPRYSKNKPKSEDIQKHFQQFIHKAEKPQLNMFVTDESNLETLLTQDESQILQEIADAKVYTDIVVHPKGSVGPEIVESDPYNIMQTIGFNMASVTDNTIACECKGPTGSFKPTQKEIELSKQTFNTLQPRKRGVKLNKSKGSNNE